MVQDSPLKQTKLKVQGQEGLEEPPQIHCIFPYRLSFLSLVLLGSIYLLRYQKYWISPNPYYSYVTYRRATLPRNKNIHNSPTLVDTVVGFWAELRPSVMWSWGQFQYIVIPRSTLFGGSFKNRSGWKIYRYRYMKNVSDVTTHGGVKMFIFYCLLPIWILQGLGVHMSWMG